MRNKRNSTMTAALFLLFATVTSSYLFAQLQERTHFRSERMAAWHASQVAVDEAFPNTAMITYVTDRGTHTDRYMFTKIIPFVKINGDFLGTSKAKFVQVDDIPGYVNATYMLGETKVEFNAVPLLKGRGVERDKQNGAILYTIKTTPAAEIELRCGGGGIYSHPYPREKHQAEDFNGVDADINLAGKIATLKHSVYGPYYVAISTSGTMDIKTGADNAKYFKTNFKSGEGKIIVGFGPNFEVAKRNAQLDAKKEFALVKDYYNKLLSSRIETPEKLLDQAFNSAIYNIEYNWYDPFGWIECIHHWASMFHMQHTPAAQWLDQVDRSRKTTLSQAHKLHKSGAAPDLFPGGQKYHAFGGTNQFFTYQISKYWDFTADLDFLKEVTPYLDKVMAQTLEEYDPEGDLLFAWRSQIGQQEDYLHHPYNSTSPSIESINMMRTRLKIAKVLGEVKLVTALTARIQATQEALMRELWDPTLGRFLYYKDPQEKLHLDGQYETYCYPAAFDIVDKFDAYTNLRHLRDRLTGDGGEVYCSNNFSNHIHGTWGMQAGAAQQPVAAWAMNKTGLRNEAYIPLKAAAQWAMSDNQRGAWPEVSFHGTADYFSPPAAVYIQIMIESIFGLNMDKPNNSLTISPAFPDTWPNAKLNLPKFKADFLRKGNKLIYNVETLDSLKRNVRWLIAPAQVKSVRVNGKKVKFTTKPAIGCVELSFESGECKKSEIVIDTKPINYEVNYNKSIALAQPFTVETSGCKIAAVEDRSGILTDSFITSDKKLSGIISNSLLRNYEGYARLGDMNFACRTFFILCDAGKGVKFYTPIDITLLKEIEATQIGDFKVTRNGASVELLVRNNTETDINGTALLDAARGVWDFEVKIPARSEKTCSVEIPANRLALLSPGENIATLSLPNGKSVSIRLIATEIFKSIAPLKDYITNCFEQIELPQDDYVSDKKWTSFRPFRPRHHVPWVWSPDTLSELTTETITHPDLPVEFKVNGQKMVPISWTLDKQDYTIQLQGKTYKKLYMLVVPYLDSHDMFSPVGRVCVTNTQNRIIGVRTLRFPGDLDAFWPIVPLDIFSTSRFARENRFGILPQIGADQGDWGKLSTPENSEWKEEFTINSFPQPAFWATCLPVDIGSATLSIIEVNLRKPTELRTLTLSTIGTEPAFGIISVVGEVDKSMELLNNTPYMPDKEFLAEDNAATKRSLEKMFADWNIEGNAFSIGAYAPLFKEPTFNSRCLAGEPATGKAFSPIMTLVKESISIRLLLQGGDNLGHGKEGKLYIDVIDTETREILKRHYIHGNHFQRWEGINLKTKIGQKVQLVIVDDADAQAYSWFGIANMVISED